MKYTIKDVAKKTNISITTVSCVSNRSKDVSAKTCRHILNVIKELGYSPSAMASGLKICLSESISVSDDVSIVRFDDSYISPYIIPRLTTIKQRREEMGKVAAELLLNRMSSQNKKKKTLRQIIIPVELIERESAIFFSSNEGGDRLE